MAEQEWVEIEHPDVEGTATVAEISVPVHERSGWKRVQKSAKKVAPAASKNEGTA